MNNTKPKVESSTQTSLKNLILSDETLGKSIDFSDFDFPGFLKEPFHLSPLAEKMRAVKWEVLNKTQSHEKAHSMMVVSACNHDGKSALAFNCAVSIALEREWSSVLIDTCGDSQSLTARFHLSQALGLTDYLSGKAALEAILYPTSQAKCFMIPIGQNLDQRSELLASQNMAAFIEAIHHSMNQTMLVFDTNAIETFADYKVLSNHVDQILFVIKSGVTPEALVKKSIALLPQDKITGIVLNQDEWA